MTDTIRPTWAHRLKQSDIRRLYESEASGLLDEELLNEVFLSLYLRCESMLIVTTAHHGGPIPCPMCKTTANRCGEEQILCPACGWSITWSEYHKSYRNKGLHAGGTVPFIEEFLKAASVPRTPREKMLLIDRLIHVFHWEMVGSPCRPGAANLIVGGEAQVLAFLHDLTNSAPSQDPLIQKRWAEWEQTIAEIRSKSEAGQQKYFQKKQKAMEIKQRRAERATLRAQSQSKFLRKPEDLSD